MGNESSRRSFGSADFVIPHVMNNANPLKFHSVHGENINLSNNDTVATREGGFCKAIAFSHRPVAINEHIYVKFVDVQRCWSGALRIGFTSHDPIVYRNKLPKYSCPCMTEMPGNWARALTEQFAVPNSILFYYVDMSGDVHYGFDSEERGIFFSGVNTNNKLWAMLDVYGNTVKIELLDPHRIESLRNNTRSLTSQEVVETRTNISTARPTSNLIPFAFHTSHGRDVFIQGNRAIVQNSSGISQCSYVFTEKSIGVKECAIFKVVQCNPSITNHMIIGVTACCPSSLSLDEFPDDPNCLLDRPEYWVLYTCEQVFQPNDTLAFIIESDGALKYSRNSDGFSVLFYVDTAATLWFFINLCGAVTEIQTEGLMQIPADLSMETILKCTQDISENRQQLLHHSVSDHSSQNRSNSDSECMICCEKPSNSALYRCGHVCMCYTCALLVKDRDPQCPLCREAIVDVIEIFT